MIKNNYFVKFLKKIYLSINSLLKKYLNKLNLNNLSNIARSNKVFLTIVTTIILFLFYLSIPHVYDKKEIQKELKNQLRDKFSLNFVFSKDFNYKFYPRPHFVVKDSFILENQLKVSDIKKLSIFVSLDNLFSLKNITIKNVILENTNFNLNKNNSDFFTNLLNNNFLNSSFNIKNSNIFFRNVDQEVLFINKIIDMNYYYDSKELKNIVKSENELFNIPYSFNLYNDKSKKKIFSSINFNHLKLQIKNELDYTNNKKKGLINFIYDKNKSKAFYEWNKNSFNFNYFDKLTDSNFSYKGDINFNRFYSIFLGNIKNINLSSLTAYNSLFIQLFKTEILNNKNLNIDLNINGEKISQFQNIINIFLNFKIYEGLIDIDTTKFSWNNYADFEILDSLLYVSKNQLILNGKFIINVKNYDKIYKFLQTSRNLRPEIKNLEFNFNYNFDEQIIDVNNIKIDNQTNENVEKVFKKIILKKNNLQNKIYLKNMIRKAIAAYAG